MACAADFRRSLAVAGSGSICSTDVGGDVVDVGTASSLDMVADVVGVGIIVSVDILRDVACEWDGFFVSTTGVGGDFSLDMTCSVE